MDIDVPQNAGMQTMKHAEMQLHNTIVKAVLIAATQGGVHPANVLAILARCIGYTIDFMHEVTSVEALRAITVERWIEMSVANIKLGMKDNPNREARESDTPSD